MEFDFFLHSFIHRNILLFLGMISDPYSKAVAKGVTQLCYTHDTIVNSGNPSNEYRHINSENMLLLLSVKKSPSVLFIKFNPIFDGRLQFDPSVHQISFNRKINM